MSALLGVDVGGTFTDFFVIDTASGETRVHKVASTPDDPSRAVLAGLAAIDPHLRDGLAFLAHGTTVATNALIQRRGAGVVLVTTAGFKDLLEIGRQTRPKIYDLKADHPEPLVPRENRLEIKERVGPRGEVISALADEEIARVVDAVRERGGQSVAVCLLFSFLNPTHERRVGDALRRALPDRDISLSCEVQAEFREYERLSTTVLNAFLQPEVGRYMRRLAGALTAKAPHAHIGICQSSGGLMSIARAAEMPIRTALSGPAAGVVGAIAVGRRSGHGDLITFDMGGTSTDVCLVRQGTAEMAFGRSVAGFPIRLPAVDIHTVGAGGGSIAHIAKDGLMKVGPESAGAMPGPACYGQGGTDATVTDANLLLGRLPAELVGGGMQLDVGLAENSIAQLARRLGLGLRETAVGIVRIVNSNMVRAIRAVSVERGHDPRPLTLMPFGGAGALHAVDVAQELGMRTILVPPAPGILCAEGVAVAELQEGLVATCRTSLAADLAPVEGAVARLLQDAEAWFVRERIDPASRRSCVTLDMRYIGQNYELSIGLPAGLSRLPPRAELQARFFDAHRLKYGHSDTEAPVEIVNVRVLASAGREIVATAIPPERGPTSAAARNLRPVWFDAGTATETPCIDRDTLAPGATLDGPAVITQFDATTLLPPRCSLTVTQSRSLLIEVSP